MILVCSYIHFLYQLNDFYYILTLFNYLLEYNFSYPGINDGKPETIKPWHDLKQSFIQDADKITNVVQNVYDQTQVTDPWEVNDVHIYVFDVQRTNFDQISQIEYNNEPIMISQDLSLSNLLQSLTQLAQKSRQLGLLSSQKPNEEIRTFYSDLQYILFNSIQPVFSSFFFLITILILMIWMFVAVTLKVIRNRHEVMIQLFDVPKARMQSVIRRILQEENGEGDQYSTINANNDFADMKLGLNDKQDQQNCEKHEQEIDQDLNVEQIDHDRRIGDQIEIKGLDFDSENIINLMDNTKDKETQMNNDQSQNNNKIHQIEYQQHISQDLEGKEKKIFSQYLSDIPAVPSNENLNLSSNSNFKLNNINSIQIGKNANIMNQPLTIQPFNDIGLNFPELNILPIFNQTQPQNKLIISDKISNQQSIEDGEKLRNILSIDLNSQGISNEKLDLLNLKGNEIINEMNEFNIDNKNEKENLKTLPIQQSFPQLPLQLPEFNIQLPNPQFGNILPQSSLQVLPYNPPNRNIFQVPFITNSFTYPHQQNYQFKQPFNGAFGGIKTGTSTLGNQNSFFNSNSNISYNPSKFDSPKKQQEELFKDMSSNLDMDKKEQKYQKKKEERKLKEDFNIQLIQYKQDKTDKDKIKKYGFISQKHNKNKKNIKDQEEQEINNQGKNEMKNNQKGKNKDNHKNKTELNQQNYKLDKKKEIFQNSKQNNDNKQEQGGNKDLISNEVQNNYVRDEIEDNKWVEKFHDDIEHLQKSYDQFPNPMILFDYIYMIITGGVSLVAIITYIIIVVIYVSYNQQTSAVVILSGLRSPVLQQSSYFILRTICDFKCVKPIKNIVFPSIANAVWTDDTHTTTDRKLALQTAYQLSNHFLKLLMNVHYGTNKYSAITDHHLSSIKTQRMDYNLNADLLFKQSDCFLTTVPCDEASPDRIYSVELPIFGLQELIVRMRFYLELMVHMNPQQLDEKNRYVRYLVTAIRNDLREGFNQLTSDIEKQGEDSINDSQTVLIIIAVCFSITILGTMILVALPWGFSMQDRTNQSQRLIDLMPYLENEKEMALLPSMRTGHIKMDKQREIIMDQGEQIINAMKRHDQIGTVIQLFDVLIGSVQKTFNEEDKEMEEKEYDIEKANHHIEDHIILRQRLTLLLDELRSLSGKREAVQNTVRKTLTRLFDHHFLDQDVAFVKSVFKFDNQTENNYTQEDANNEKMEQQITNISDMHSDI